jgi:hypothetical protein
MSETEILKPSQKEVDLDTDGFEDKEISFEETPKEEPKIKLPSEEVIPDGTEVNANQDDKIEVVEAEEQPEEKKDNLQKTANTYQERINELTRKRREAERREKAALQYAKGLQKQFEDVQKRFPKVEENYLREFEARVTADEASAQSYLQKAIESQDAIEIAKANQKLIAINIEKERMNNAKILREQQIEQQKASQQVSQPISQAQSQNFVDPPVLPSPRAEAWAEQNTWFGDDEVMTDAALALDKKIKAEGIAGDSDEYYNQLNKRLRDYFPSRFAVEEKQPTTEQRRPVQTVASAQRNQSGRRTVKLTKSQLAISKKLGVPPEEYAKYVK